MPRIGATYRTETAHTLDKAAKSMAGEQSSGTFVDVPGEADELRERYGAQVESIPELETVDEPTVSGISPSDGITDPAGYTRAEFELSFSLENVGRSLPNPMTTVASNLFNLSPFSGLRLLDIAVPAGLADAYPGSQFGIEGGRDVIDVWDRPIIGTIIKSNVGLSAEKSANLVETLVESALDFIKNDEWIADPPYSSEEERVEAVMDVIRHHENETGKKVIYACIITGDVDEMLKRHDVVKDSAGNCVMVSMNSVGLSEFTELRRHSDLPIHAHRNGWGALSRCLQLGFEYTAYQKFWRLADADHMHEDGLKNLFCESDDAVIKSGRTCQSPIFDESDMVMPVFSSGQWAGQAPDTYEVLGNADLMFLTGSGIMDHPNGPAAGVTHLKQGWEAAMEGVPLEEYAEDHQALRLAIEHYGPVGSGR